MYAVDVGKNPSESVLPFKDNSNKNIAIAVAVAVVIHGLVFCIRIPTEVNKSSATNEIQVTLASPDTERAVRTGASVSNKNMSSGRKSQRLATSSMKLNTYSVSPTRHSPAVPRLLVRAARPNATLARADRESAVRMPVTDGVLPRSASQNKMQTVNPPASNANVFGPNGLATTLPVSYSKTGVRDVSRGIQTHASGAPVSNAVSLVPPSEAAPPRGETVPAPATPQSSSLDLGPLIPASRIGSSKPVYPEEARERGIEGTVVLTLNISDNGTVDAVEIHKTSGSHDLDMTAVRAAQGWKFNPKHRGNVTMRSTLRLSVRFRLDDNS